MDMLQAELLEVGWSMEPWGGDYGDSYYIGPKRLMDRKQLHDHADYIRWKEWSDSTKE